MTIKQNMAKLCNLISDKYENDAVKVELNYDPLTRCIIVGIDYPLADNVIVWNWEIPIIGVDEFFQEITEFIVERYEMFRNEIAKLYGYEPHEENDGQEYL